MHVAIRIAGLFMILYSISKSFNCRDKGDHKDAYFYLLHAIFVAVLTV
jgi:hypothetical protein